MQRIIDDNPEEAELKSFRTSLHKREFVPEYRVHLGLDYNLVVGENEYIPKRLSLMLPLHHVRQIVQDLQTHLDEIPS